MSKLIIAHRGGNEFAPENSLEAIQKAIEIEVPMFEFDLRRTKDGKLVVFHDPHLLTYEELNKQTKRKIPLLEDVLKLSKGKIQIDLEIKEAGYEAETIKMIKDYFNLDEIIITSFKSSVLRTIKRIEPKLKTGLIIGKKSPWHVFKDLFAIFRLKILKADILVTNHHYLKIKLYYIAYWLRIPVYVWTVNDEKLIKKYIQDKKISAIITDKPQKALKLLSMSGSLRK